MVRRINVRDAHRNNFLFQPDLSTVEWIGVMKRNPGFDMRKVQQVLQVFQQVAHGIV